MAWLNEQAICSDHDGSGRNYWWVAPVFSQTKIAFRRLKRFIDPKFYSAREDELKVTLINGACIWFKSADNPDSLYGEDVYAAVLDEASRAKEEAWFALRSTLTATRGKIRLIGNVKGRKNFFYNLCRKAQMGDPDMEYHIITAYDAVEAGILAREEVEDAKRVLPESVFNELYLCQPSDDGGNPFGLQHIAACEGEKSTGQVSVWGIDLAKSVDYTVMIGLDSGGREVETHRFRKPWNETIRFIRSTVGNKPALIDSTGVGDPIVEALQEGGNLNFEGFKFTSASKQMIMEGLAVAIQNRHFTYNTPIIRQELEIYEYEYTRTGVRYTAPEGMHDDCVCAAALAVKKLGEPVVGSNVLEFYEKYMINKERRT